MSRKDDHVKMALNQTVISNDFDKIHITHHSLAAIDINTISTQTKIGSLQLSYPFYINAMTGGTEFTNQINEKLAIVARETGLMLAVGSMSTLFKDERLRSHYQLLRNINPTGLMLANLNLNYNLDQAKICLDLLQADGIQFHINSPQEIVMSEGDRQFEHWPEKIRQFNQLDTNVIIKEVGFGMSTKTIQQLINLNTKIIDVSGKGGTNFVQIESERSHYQFDYLNQWGESTVTSLLNAQPMMNQATFIASGGIRNPLDIIKALMLGAKAVGVSKTILKQLIDCGVEETIAMIHLWQKQLTLIMALVGAHNIHELTTLDYQLL